MKILRHRLSSDDGTSLPYQRSPNVGGDLAAEFLVIHYTAGRSADDSINWLTNRAARASAHVVIGRDGTVTQLVPFNRVAWHAGRSAWKNRVGLNRFSIGIELDNAGRLTRTGEAWRSWFGQTYPPGQIIEAIHKHESQLCGWHVFTEEQMASALEVSSLLIAKYELKDVLGHDDISPGRKQDPGPAFPMPQFKARLLGRSENQALRYQTTTHLNIRSGPGSRHERLEGSPLPPETEVLVLREEGSWCFVDVLDVVGDIMDLQGWVHGRYLELEE